MVQAKLSSSISNITKYAAPLHTSALLSSDISRTDNFDRLNSFLYVMAMIQNVYSANNRLVMLLGFLLPTLLRYTAILRMTKQDAQNRINNATPKQAIKRTGSTKDFFASFIEFEITCCE